MEYVIEQISKGPKHHMFGFHDLIQTNADGNFALALEINDISRPPLPGEECKSGVIDLRTKEYVQIHSTHTWNYPQGARQQWIGRSNLFLCNDREQDGRLVSRVSCAQKGKVVDTLPFPVHCINSDLQKAIYINYDRLHAVGAYGYVPNRKLGYQHIEDLPENDGLWIGDLQSKQVVGLLASIREIASCGEKSVRKTGFPHYVTHPMLNPRGDRIAFLHRYRVPDGGETTRLMSIGIDGSGLRCLAKGFLSHFTWTSNEEIFIWGAHQPKIYSMRESAYLRFPGVLKMSKLAKSAIRFLRRTHHSTTSSLQSHAFLTIVDQEGGAIEKSALGVIVEDGHPMACPKQLREVICDTYPNSKGDRQLFLYNLDQNVRKEISTFRRIFSEPDKDTFDYRMVQSGTDVRIAKRFDLSHYLFARSGFHCDLHPRWSYDGEFVFFDSIHDGTRQLYRVKVGDER